MSKAVLISIQPKWCELIVSGKKTVEVRKSRPKLGTPFKCYIYCTLGDCGKVDIGKRGNCYNGKVIGEFVCDEVFQIYQCVEVHDELLSCPIERWLEWDSDDEEALLEHSCLNYSEIVSYLGKSGKGYGWHISDLVIYDRPKELSHFTKSCDRKTCEGCEYLDIAEIGAYEHTKTLKTCLNRVTRPPQSWCYVEETHNAN